MSFSLFSTFFFNYTVNYWLGQHRIAGDSDFKNPYTNESLGNLPLIGFNGEDKTSEISGDICVRYYGNEIRMVPCGDSLTCAFCYLNERNQTLTMKGIRYEDVYDNVEFDREYYIYGYRNQHFLFE